MLKPEVGWEQGQVRATQAGHCFQKELKVILELLSLAGHSLLPRASSQVLSLFLQNLVPDSNSTDQAASTPADTKKLALFPAPGVEKAPAAVGLADTRGYLR